jgi:UTP-glucose-1-phosphate uridylyltransferase
MIDAYEQCGGNMLGVMDIPREQTASYGIVDIEKCRIDYKWYPAGCKR